MFNRSRSDHKARVLLPANAWGSAWLRLARCYRFYGYFYFTFTMTPDCCFAPGRS